jgi:hypothetical protein
MTETQTNHRAPLAPGEIRTHTVGDRTFQVMHTGRGMNTKATYRDGVDGVTQVLCTGYEFRAVRAYADAIEQAESDAIDALDDADGMSFDASGAYFDREPKRVLVVEEREIVHRCPPTGSNTMPCCGVTPWEIPTYHRMTVEDDRVTCKPRLDAAEMTDEPLGAFLPTPEPGSLAALIDAYGEAMAKGATCIVLGRRAELVEYAGRADALKAEILARFGGER